MIARRLGLPLSTIGRVLHRLGLGRLKRLAPPAPVVRYQRERPGGLVHIDPKKLGKIAGIGHRITGRRSGMVNAILASAGNTCTSRPTTPRLHRAPLRADHQGRP